MKVRMSPSLPAMENMESGIKRVVEAYYRYLPEHGIELVDDPHKPADITAVHAGAQVNVCNVAHLHGLYFTGDYTATTAEYVTNARIVDTIRMSREVTVPSTWVAELIARNFRFWPHVVPHGIEWDEWQEEAPPGDYILAYAKNRAKVDVCDPAFLARFAPMFPDIKMVATFAPPSFTSRNVVTTGVLHHSEMKRIVKSSLVYINTTKETFGIAILEAMASGVPVLSYAHGGALDTVVHGVNGYLARPNDIDDLAAGLRYCLEHRAVLGANGREMAKKWTWAESVRKVARIYRQAAIIEKPTVGVVIPVFKKTPEEVERAIASVEAQTIPVSSVIVVDDGSDNGEAIHEVVRSHPTAAYIRQDNRGVAHARNRGVAELDTKYVCCLDADDKIEPGFLEACVTGLEADDSLGVAYTALQWIKPDGSTGVSPWPGEWNYDDFLRRQNQVPTCCVFRRKVWQRLGGYRQRYAPGGAGAEDAEFWLRAGAYGWRGRRVTSEPLFTYSWMSGLVTGNPEYRETDWLAWHPWASDGKHPFGSYASSGRHASHAVSNVDDPSVAIIIPVGPGHEEIVIDALDSVEAQTFRNWEVIVSWDIAGTIPVDLMESYPFARFVGGGDVKRGAGAARNRGVAVARAPMILFLDADDFLAPTALQRMLTYWSGTGHGVYSDFNVIYPLPTVENLPPEISSRLIEYNERKKEALLRYESSGYKCEEAQAQPTGGGSLWCPVTVLIPRQWHDEIGGFDEEMVSLEDADYYYRMAWEAKCFIRVPEPLMTYRYQPDGRAAAGWRERENLISYIEAKKAIAEIKMCGCQNKESSLPGGVPAAAGPLRADSNGRNTIMSDDEYVLVTYSSPNRAKEGVYGGGRPQRRYGARMPGDTFLVHRDDVKDFPHKFIPLDNRPVAPTPPPEPVPPPEPISVPDIDFDWDEPPTAEELRLEAILDYGPFKLEDIPAVTANVAKALEAKGVASLEDIVALGVDGLRTIKYVGAVRAQQIYDYARNHVN